MTLEALIPHRTRVLVRDRGEGMVIRIENARTRLINGGRQRLRVPAQVHVILDDGTRAVVEPHQVDVVEHQS